MKNINNKCYVPHRFKVGRMHCLDTWLLGTCIVLLVIGVIAGVCWVLVKMHTGYPSDVRCILLPCGQFWTDHVGHMDTVVSDDRDVFRDPKACLADGVDSSEIGIIIGKQDAGRSFRQCKQALGRLIATDRFMVLAFLDEFVWNRQLEVVACTEEACQSVFRNGRRVAMNISDTAMAFSIHIADERLYASHVVGEDCRPIVESMIQADDR